MEREDTRARACGRQFYDLVVLLLVCINVYCSNYAQNFLLGLLKMKYMRSFTVAKVGIKGLDPTGKLDV